MVLNMSKATLEWQHLSASTMILKLKVRLPFYDFVCKFTYVRLIVVWKYGTQTLQSWILWTIVHINLLVFVEQKARLKATANFEFGLQFHYASKLFGYHLGDDQAEANSLCVDILCIFEASE